MPKPMMLLEDVNSIDFLKKDINEMYVIDTSLIGNGEFTDIKYDFCVVSHSINSSTHTFSFQISNSLWTGEYYFTDKDGNYINSNGNYQNGTLSLSTNKTSVILHLYLCGAMPSTDFAIKRLEYIINVENSASSVINFIDTVRFDVSNLKNQSYTNNVTLYQLDDGAWSNIISKRITYNDGTPYIEFDLEGEFKIFRITFSGHRFYFMINKSKTRFPLDSHLSPSIFKTGIINNISIETDFNDNEYEIEGTVYYQNNEISIENGEFELDLRNKRDIEKIELEFEIYENSNFIYSTDKIKFSCEYVDITTEEELHSAIDNGISIFNLQSDLTLSMPVNLTNDIKVIGNDYSVDMNHNSFIIFDNVKVNIENLELLNGDPAFIQNLGSELNLDNIVFKHCFNTSNNNLGACIQTKTSYDYLSVSDDFLTNLLNCTFIDNHSAVFHGGEILFKQCKLHNTDLDYVNPNNPALLYQTDGEAVISNNIFDIDYSDSTLCNNQRSIDFGQCLIICGENAIINGATYDSLQEDNSLPLFDNKYNNICHLFAEYYYSQIDTCVYSSPVENKEEKSVCHAVSGINWVFKNNVKITRKSWNTENRYNSIQWED